MAEHVFSSTHTTPILSRRVPSQHSLGTRRTRPNLSKRMRNLLCCGLIQDQTPSAQRPLTLASNLQTNSTTSMATVVNDHSGWYTTNCGTCRYTLPIRYKNLVPIGQGAFGIVIRATDTVTGKGVAIKKMLTPFQCQENAKRTYRELKLLTYLNHPDAQVVQLYNVFTTDKTLKDFQTLYFVFNLADFDLNKVIKRRIPFLEGQIKQLIYSLLRGLKFIHSAHIIHRDLKPTNIGITTHYDLTILDFGLARVASNGIQTGYVATRWWRAPEVFVNWERYDEKLDIWSVGCIMAELILLRPIFAGNGHIDQLNKIFDVIGTPDEAILDELCEPNSREYIRDLPRKEKQDFNRLFSYRYDPGTPTPRSGVSPEGIDFLDRLLTFDHRIRPTAEEALAHRFLDNFHEPDEEPTIQPIIDEHQDREYSIEKWKSLVWKMIEEFQPPPWATENPADVL